MAHLVRGAGLDHLAAPAGSRLRLIDSEVKERDLQVGDLTCDLYELRFAAPEAPGRPLRLVLPYCHDTNDWLLSLAACPVDFPFEYRFDAIARAALDKVKIVGT